MVFVSAVNHAEAVLPACQAVVHHGGAGTTAAAMRAGVPSLILWLWLDQPVWASAVEQLKIGAAQRFSKATEKSLVADLKAILTPEYLTRARNIAAQMMSPPTKALPALLISSRAEMKRGRDHRSQIPLAEVGGEHLIDVDVYAAEERARARRSSTTSWYSTAVESRCSVRPALGLPGPLVTCRTGVPLARRR